MCRLYIIFVFIAYCHESKAGLVDRIMNKLSSPSKPKQVERVEDNIDELNDAYEAIKGSINTAKLHQDDSFWYAWNNTNNHDQISTPTSLNANNNAPIGTEVSDIGDYAFEPETEIPNKNMLNENILFSHHNSDAKVTNKHTDDLDSNMSARSLDDHHSMSTSNTSVKVGNRADHATIGHLSKLESNKMNRTTEPHNNGSSQATSSSMAYPLTYGNQIWLLCISLYPLVILL